MCDREDSRQYQGETICTFGMVICRYLWILVFVWALVSSGLRYDQSASIECNGVTQKIQMRKSLRGLGPRGAQVAPLRVHCASVLCTVWKDCKWFNVLCWKDQHISWKQKLSEVRYVFGAMITILNMYSRTDQRNLVLEFSFVFRVWTFSRMSACWCYLMVSGWWERVHLAA